MNLLKRIQRFEANTILDDYTTFKQTTGTMIPEVYVGSVVI